MSDVTEIKSAVFKGGVFLGLRQVVSAVLSVLSVLTMARVLGPESYGIVASALGILYFLAWTSQLGLNAYLVRAPEVAKELPEQLLAFSNALAIAACAIVWIGAPLLSEWTEIPEITDILRLMVPCILLHVIKEVSMAMLTRELRFHEVSIVDMASQFANYAIAIPLTLAFKSYWGPLSGALVQFLSAAILAYHFHPIRFTSRWKWSALRPVVGYGVTYFFASWVQVLRALTIPLFVAPLAGIEAAGIAGITLRMLEQLSMIRAVIKSMSMSVMSKLTDSAAVRRAVDQGMIYIALLMAVTCATFACVSPWIIPLFFGERWVESAHLFPALALVAIVSAMFDLHLSVLHAVGKNLIVALQSLVGVISVWGSCALAIPSLGLWGYAIAELLALPSFLIVHEAFRRLYGSPSYCIPAVVIFALTPPLLLSQSHSPLIAIPTLVVSLCLIVTFSRPIRITIKEVVTALLARRQRREAVVA
jgi:PST family polysaccharide transporter